MSLEEENRALKGQLESLQKAYDISEEIVRKLEAQVAALTKRLSLSKPDSVDLIG